MPIRSASVFRFIPRTAFLNMGGFDRRLRPSCLPGFAETPRQSRPCSKRTPTAPEAAPAPPRTNRARLRRGNRSGAKPLCRKHLRPHPRCKRKTAPARNRTFPLLPCRLRRERGFAMMDSCVEGRHWWNTFWCLYAFWRQRLQPDSSSKHCASSITAPRWCWARTILKQRSLK